MPSGNAKAAQPTGAMLREANRTVEKRLPMIFDRAGGSGQQKAVEPGHGHAGTTDQTELRGQPAARVMLWFQTSR